jgi:predicted 2-oxoglutarate/Fe(II)-dependent dioxygenase YbiX
MRQQVSGPNIDTLPDWKEEARSVFSFRFFEKKTCRAMLQQMKRLDDWEDAEVRNQVSPQEFITSVRADTRIANILISAHCGKWYQLFDREMDQAVKPMIQNLFGISLHEHSGTQVLRYPRGGHYVPHQDAMTDMRYRYFTVVCYLNDDFEGGDTWFPSLDHAVLPETGKAILFPSSFYHCARPVVRGEKFVIVSWVIGPLPVTWI